MAKQTVVVDLKTNTGDSVNSIKQLNSEMNQLQKNAKDTGQALDKAVASPTLEQQLEALNKQIDSGELSFQQMTKAIKDYQTIAFKAGATSPVGTKAIEQAGNLRDRLADIDTRSRQLSSDYAKMDAALQGASAAMGGFSAFQGVATLMGTENEELMKTMVKLQAATSTLNGIQSVRNALNKDSMLVQQSQIAMNKIQTSGIYAWATAQKVAAVSTAIGTKALKLFRLALIGTGIGALILGIGLLIANFDKLKGFFTGEKKIANWFKIAFFPVYAIIKGIQILTNSVKGLVQLFGEQGGVMESLTHSMNKFLEEELAGIKKRREALTESYNSEQKAIDRQIKLRKLEGKEFNDLTQDKIKGTIEYKQQMVISMQEELKALQKVNLERQKSLILIAANKAQIESVNAQIQALNDEVIDSQIELKENEKAVLDKRAEKQKAFRDAQLAKEKAFRDELLRIQREQEARMNELLDEIAQVEEDYLTSSRDKAVNAVTDKYFRLIEEAKQYGYDTSTLEQAQQAELTTLRDGFAKEDLERQRNAQNMITDNRIALMKEGQDRERAEVEENYARLTIETLENEKLLEAEKLEVLKQLKELEGQELKAIADKYAEEEKQLRIDKFNEYAQTVQDGISAISAINELAADLAIRRAEGDEKKQEKIARRAFNINKALQLASATVSGIQAVQNAYTTAQASPITLANPAYPFIAAGIAAATSAANIAKIATARFEGSGGVSAPAGGASQGASAATFSIGANTNTEQTQLNPDGTQANGGGMVKVFVAESDITETQNNVQQINTLSTF